MFVSTKIPTPRRRIALYSHDTQGLGHIRRNLALAAALVDARDDTDVLLITGAAEATSLPMPPHTEALTLPGVAKDQDGDYRPRTLGLPLTEVVGIRRAVIRAAIESFEPDLLIVDKVARGLGGELESTLVHLRRVGARTVLGLRDVLDEPVSAVHEWHHLRTTEVVREQYDQVWVYGDRSVYDLLDAYDLPSDVSERTVFTGYLGGDRSSGVSSRDAGLAAPRPAGPYVLCLVGGGQDGADLATAFAATVLPPGHQGVLVAGPYLDEDVRKRLERVAARRGDLTVHRLVTNCVDLLEEAAATVLMGGYNSVCEVLRAGCPALVVPRVAPRQEQLVRAQRLSDLGAVTEVHPDDASPRVLGEWLIRAVDPRSGARSVSRAIDLGGLTRVPQLADALLAAAPSTHPGDTRVAV